MEQPLFVDNTDPEFDLMFKGLFDAYSDYECPESNEVWQYMGTWLIDGTRQHQFRHRSYMGGRKIVNMAPSSTYLNKIPQLLTKAM